MTEEHSPFIMEDYTTRTYGTGGLDNRPLFGETSARVLGLWALLRAEYNGSSVAGIWNVGSWEDRIINIIVGVLTSLLVLVTFISAFVFPQPPPKPVNVVFAFCILLCSITGLILIFWYRQGDLEPKFRNLIYYILFSVVMLCICANLYFHDVGK